MKKEFKVIADLLPNDSRVLDVGCGDGSLMNFLVKEKNIETRGLELDQNNVQESIIDPNSCLRQFLNSSWSIDDSIGLEKAFNADGLNNGRSIFLDDKIIHSYFYL